MCGIAGFIGAGDAEDLRRMMQALRHRGPDASGEARDEPHGVWLGHQRLEVIDREGGEQPMWSADRRVVLIFNGEIYDAAALRKDLENRGRVFRTHHSDTEVLIHAYLEWGPDFVERLNGMWAFALWDRAARRLLLSRDRFGQKPLYWTQRPGCFAFASELTALTRHSHVAAEVSPAALRKYFAYGFVPAPCSLVEGVRKLPGGCNLSLQLPQASPRIQRWWEFRIEPEPQRAALPELCDALRERLDRAVARRLVADVPLGVFLSGGIDSATIAHFAAQRLDPGALRTFSMGFEEASFDETAHAERAARHVGSRHHAAMCSMERAREILPDLARRLDEPLGDVSLLPTHLLCSAARREVTVALGGDGGDELFAGYDPFRALALAEAYQRLVPRPVHQAIRLLAARLPTAHRNMSLDFRVKRTLLGLSQRPALWNPIWMSPLAPRELAEFLAEPVDAEDVYSEAIAAWESCPADNSVDRTLQYFTRVYLQDDILTKIDRASMLCALEVRSPFLDIELVDFVRRLPHPYKLQRGVTKRLLRSAMQARLPREILTRAKKGFGVPVGAWIRDGAAPFDAFPPLGTGACAQFLAAKLAEHRAGRADHRLFLYAHWLLARWGAGEPAAER
ncbi:MAG: asparagine synthase (glutamine-hydrolyzing) [Myxococcales bacterium]|nr:asparagine synthase (glutamine-hydrolyzing) [Myxococcales bacterium]